MKRILLVGVGRSGTTWAARALGQAAGTTLVVEPDDEDYNMYAPIGTRGLPHHPVLAPGERAPHYQLLWQVAFSGGWPFVPARLASRLYWGIYDTRLGTAWRHWLKGPSAAALGEPMARALLRLRRPHRCVLVKTVHAMFSLDWVVERFQPRVVILRRHPLSIIASRLELDWIPPPLDLGAIERVHPGLLPPSPAEPLSLLVQTAWGVGVLLRALDAAAARRPDWLVVHHEWLCQDPPGRFARLCQQLGLAWSERLERFLERSNRRGSGYQTQRLAEQQHQAPWQGRLTPDQVDQARAVLAPMGIKAD